MPRSGSNICPFDEILEQLEVVFKRFTRHLTLNYFVLDAPLESDEVEEFVESLFEAPAFDESELLALPAPEPAGC